MIKVTESGQVIYKTEHSECQKFPDPASDTLQCGVSRNFEILEPLDFLAEITQHIPEPRAHTINYFGWYSNKSRGMRAKLHVDPVVKEYLEIHDDDTPHRKLCRSRWAALIKKVYEVDPLICPDCGGEMKFIAFIEKRDQPDVIEKILKHCKLWQEPEKRGPPDVEIKPELIDFILEPEYIPIDQFLADF